MSDYLDRIPSKPMAVGEIYVEARAVHPTDRIKPYIARRYVVIDEALYLQWAYGESEAAALAAIDAELESLEIRKVVD